MKNLLFVYTKMIIGGSTTSLLSILNNLDYKELNVDLLLLDNTGVLQKSIPKSVNILPSTKTNLISRYFHPCYIQNYLKSRVLSRYYGSKHIRAQIMSKCLADVSRRSDKKYDVAISFLEFWPYEYIVRKVNATKKVGWIHIDYKAIGVLPNLDKNTFHGLDKIITVSEECRKNFINVHPEFKCKTICIPNILSQQTIKSISVSEDPDIELKASLRFVTVCRIVFSHKGLDRGVKAFHRLKKDGFLSESIKWYIIGDGPDTENLKYLIDKFDLSKNIVLIGIQENPYKYVKLMDVFFLPSIYEGKPMAVTEAQMLGIVPLVTRYSSASEQILDGFDGIIVENNDESIYLGLKNILINTNQLELLKKNISTKDYSNIETIEKFNSII